MESCSPFDGTSPLPGTETRAAETASNLEQDMQAASSNRTHQSSVSAALAAANAALRDGATRVRFPGEVAGRSLAEMAQRDLDAALQLLTDRARYITGSSGAAIALRRAGKNDMLCRASTGSNAPELGTLLSTEFGLSGESVRTRQPLRCDDVQRDARVNRDVCREVGIASVVVMPVVHDDEVLGVFELFSGRANAFGERDVFALQRLSQMVETAVTLARVTEGIPKQLKNTGTPTSPETGNSDGTLEVQDSAIDRETKAAPKKPTLPGWETAEMVEVHEVVPEKIAVEHKAAPAAASAEEKIKALIESAVKQAPVKAKSAPAIPAEAQPEATKKALLWSAAMNLAGEAKPADADQTHVPPALRNLRKCEACGFPVSAGRTFCVECEEKKWRGQLRLPKANAVGTVSGAAAALAPSMPPVAAAASKAIELQPEVPQEVESKELVGGISTPTLDRIIAEAAQAERAAAATPMPIFTAELEPPQSWAARNKYILVVLLLVAGGIGAILLLAKF
jgi:GAF domain